MAGISVKVDDREVRRAFGNLTKQLPYALALALTKTAQSAQDSVSAHLPQHVTIRSKWISSGIRAIPATKRTLTSAVATVDAIMAGLATGGTRPQEGPDAPLVPTVGKGLPRATIATATRATKWAESLLKIREPSTGSAAYFSGKSGVYKKTGPLKARQRWHPGSGPKVRVTRAGGRALIKLAWIRPEAKIRLKRKWPFEAEVRAQVLRVWADVAAKAVEEAIRTATR